MNKHNPLERKITDWTGKKRITWCGPFSVALVSGKEYEPAYQTLKNIRGKRQETSQKLVSSSALKASGLSLIKSASSASSFLKI
jgi:hypothetical protein